MLFINISSDKVQLCDGSCEILLDRAGIEKTLGPVLVEWIRPLLTSPQRGGIKSSRAQEHAPVSLDKVLVLNWPGGFTNLRVGTLAVNMVKTLMPALQLFSVTKMDLFRFLVEKKFLPKDGLVYLGQKKNVRKFPDRDVASPDRDVALQRLYGNVFLDYVYDEEYWKWLGYDREDMVSFGCEGDALIVQYKKKKIQISVADLWLQAMAQIQPEYFISAI